LSFPNLSCLCSYCFCIDEVVTLILVRNPEFCVTWPHFPNFILLLFCTYFVHFYYLLFIICIFSSIFICIFPLSLKNHMVFIPPGFPQTYPWYFDFFLHGKNQVYFRNILHGSNLFYMSKLFFTCCVLPKTFWLYIYIFVSYPLFIFLLNLFSLFPFFP